jgi:hypothetical protein
MSNLLTEDTERVFDEIIEHGWHDDPPEPPEEDDDGGGDDGDDDWGQTLRYFLSIALGIILLLAVVMFPGRIPSLLLFALMFSITLSVAAKLVAIILRRLAS